MKEQVNLQLETLLKRYLKVRRALEFCELHGSLLIMNKAREALDSEADTDGTQPANPMTNIESQEIMKEQAQKLKNKGYDFALKGWHNDTPVNGFMLMVWKPGHVLETTINKSGHDPFELFHLILEEIERIETNG